MKTKNLTAAWMIIAMATGFASASFAEGDGGGEEECRCEPPEEPAKGNNGWGNGPDTTNAGSFSGKTADTKSVNGLGEDKFDGKFAGR